MPPVRFRIRTIMIAIASLAVLMGLLRWNAGIDMYSVFPFALVVMAVALVGAVLLFAVAVLLDFVVVPIAVSGIRSWRRRTRLRELSTTDNRPEAGIRAKRGAGGSVG
jgi:hypothetical protein